MWVRNQELWNADFPPTDKTLIKLLFLQLLFSSSRVIHTALVVVWICGGESATARGDSRQCVSLWTIAFGNIRTRLRPPSKRPGPRARTAFLRSFALVGQARFQIALLEQASFQIRRSNAFEVVTLSPSVSQLRFESWWQKLFAHSYASWICHALGATFCPWSDFGGHFRQFWQKNVAKIFGHDYFGHDYKILPICTKFYQSPQNSSNLHKILPLSTKLEQFQRN